MSTGAAPAIEVRDLGKRYGTVAAVAGITFSVAPGITCGLLGANGAGKTTTIAMLLGLVTPDAGSVRLLGQDLAVARHAVLGRVNYSSPYVDLPLRLTVRENLDVYARLYGVARPAQRIGRLAAELDLGDFLDRPYGTLSAGQKTRVALAKAVINEPELVLLDEPTASLDPDVADRMRAWLMDYRARTGATILLASHNMTEVERICDDVILMRAGRVVATGSPAALIARFGRTTMEEVFLDIARDAGPLAAAEVAP